MRLDFSFSIAGFKTLLLILSPFLFQPTLRLISSFLLKRRRAASGGGQGTSPPFRFQPPKEPPVPPFQRRLRLLIVTLFVGYHLLKAFIFTPPDIFYDSGLPLNASPAHLEAFLLSRSVAARRARGGGDGSNNGLAGLVELDPQNLYLLQSLTSLDSRLVYSMYGQTTFLSCKPDNGPCRPPSLESTGDYAKFNIPSMAVCYLIALVGIGILTQFDNGRRFKWRTLVSWATLALGGWELWESLAARGTITKGHSDLQHTTLMQRRHLGLSILTFLAYYLPPQAIPPPSPIFLISQVLNGISSQQEQLLSRLRTTSVQRMALLRDGNLRKKITSFWQEAEQQANWVHNDPLAEQERHRLGLSPAASVQPEGEVEGKGIEEGPARAMMRKHVDELWNGTRRARERERDSRSPSVGVGDER